uniref:RRM domain-containing protein n=1 Tax=Timema douglasi TaxID=61478 RepID=A0A7R8VHS0_TIMDO|nr:unnamed protein product [Timema douglasi]
MRVGSIQGMLIDFLTDFGTAPLLFGGKKPRSLMVIRRYDTDNVEKALNGHQVVFCGKVPKDMYEDELIPLFEKCGTIWDLRLMMDPMTGLNRGYAFITFTTRSSAQSAVRELDNHEIKPGKTLKVNISVPNLRLFVGNIPKSKGKEEILEEFGKLAGDGDLLIRASPSPNPSSCPAPGPHEFSEYRGNLSTVEAGLIEVIIYSSPDDKKKNRGFCFLEYESHKAASLAKRRLGTGRIKVWGCDIIVDWADPQEEPDEVTMAKVKVLYVRNLTQDCSEEKLKESFESYGTVERVKKIKDYAFIHFEDRDNAVKAMNDLNGKEMGGSPIEVSLAKPPSDKKKKEEILRARERRMMQMMQVRGGLSPSHQSMMPAALPMRAPGGALGPRGAAAGPMRGPMGRGDYVHGLAEVMIAVLGLAKVMFEELDWANVKLANVESCIVSIAAVAAGTSTVGSVGSVEMLDTNFSTLVE